MADYAREICDFVRSKVPDHMWTNHGSSIERFVQGKVMAAYRDGYEVGYGETHLPVTNESITERSLVPIEERVTVVDLALADVVDEIDELLHADRVVVPLRG